MSRIKNFLAGLGLLTLAHFFDKLYFKELPMKQVTKDWIKVLQMWGIVALFIILLALLLGCASSRPIYLAPMDGATVKKDTFVYETIAWTHCVGMSPKIQLKDGREWDEVELFGVVVHESVHYRQYKDNCLKMEALYRIFPQVRQSMELEAYCTQARYLVLRGEPSAKVYVTLRRTMFDLYDLKNATCPQPP